MSSGRIAARSEGVIRWLIIDNPERLNAMSNGMYIELYDHLCEIEEDSQTRVVLITGAGEKAFMSGGDLAEYDDNRSTEERMRNSLEISERTGVSLRQLSKPTIAVIRGWCVGGGLNLALNCDLRIASSDARFFHPAAKHGQGFAFDFTRHMVRTLGHTATREILFTARRYSADEALRIGLVNRVVPTGELMSFARSYANEIAANAPLSLLSCKKTIEQALADPAERDLVSVERLYSTCINSADYQEGARAFRERRMPSYTGS